MSTIPLKKYVLTYYIIPQPAACEIINHNVLEVSTEPSPTINAFYIAPCAIYPLIATTNFLLKTDQPTDQPTSQPANQPTNKPI